MSAIEKIEERFETVRQASFDGQGASIAVWEAEFRAALAEAWDEGKEALAAALLPDAAPLINPYREGSTS